MIGRSQILFGSLAFFAAAVGMYLLLPTSESGIERLSPGRLPMSPNDADSPASSFPEPQVAIPEPERDADKYQLHVDALRRKVSAEFTIVVEEPFVVIGDQHPTQVRQWAEGTIRWAVQRIKSQYFEKDPEHIIDVWLFRDRQSYETHAKELFGFVPSTPFGYYSSSDRALVMNISTGGGTLVHEIVHPFMEANFPSCPSWFNEGLASLYEQSADRDGQIVGLTNWRLRGLQLAIKDRLLGSFNQLMTTTDREFYDGEPTNYAQARYLCFWLQEQNLLQDYYHLFRKNALSGVDTTGIATLKELLGTDDLPGFQSSWEHYVTQLHYP